MLSGIPAECARAPSYGVLAATSLVFCLCSPSSAQQPLTHGDTLDFELDAGDTTTFSVELDAGELARIRGARRLGAVWFDVVAPGGARSRHFSPVGSYESGPILFGIDAETAGRHIVEVGSFAPASDIWVTLDSHVRGEERKRLAEELASDPRVLSVRDAMIPFSDLDGTAVRELVGDARIVLIGEDSHANGNNRVRVAQLVRALHAHAGFGIVVFEASFYDVAKSVRLARESGTPLDETILRGVHGARGSDADSRELFRYIAASSGTPTPIVPWGMDVQFAAAARAGGAWAADSLRVDLERVLSDAELLRPLRAEADLLLRAVEVRLGVTEDGVAPPREALVRAGRILSDSLDARGLPFWAQVVRSASSHLSGGGVNHRDRAMAENLDWILERHPDQKVIVLGANGHLVPRPHEMDTNGLDGWFRFSVGQHVWETRSDEAFFVQSTTFGGTFNWTSLVIADEPSVTIFEDQVAAVELEEILMAADVGDGILPLAGLAWLDDPIPSRMPWNYWTMVSRWRLHADAILFVEEAVPIRAVSPDQGH